MGVTPATICDIIVAVHSQGDVEVGYRPLIVTFCSPEPVGECIFGIEPYCDIIVSDCRFELALRAIGCSTTAMGGCVLGVELDGGIVVGNCPVVYLLVAVAVSPSSVGINMIGVEASDFVQIGDGEVKSVLLSVPFSLRGQ